MPQESRWASLCVKLVKKSRTPTQGWHEDEEAEERGRAPLGVSAVYHDKWSSGVGMPGM